MSELGHEDGNENDIKDLKKLKKKARMKRKMGCASDEPVVDKRKTGKGKGMSRGKGS